MTIIAPSLLSADWNNIDSEMQKLHHKAIKWIHFDVMDGVFVPNTTYTPEQLKMVSKYDQFHFDIHLMVADPITKASEYGKCGANSITFHIESTREPQKVIDHIKSMGLKVGISLKPNTPISAVLPYLEQIDILLIMCVEPGKGGQSFIKGSVERTKEFAKLKKEYNFLIEIDGGVKDFNAQEIIEAGADVLVAGSYIFSSSDYNQAVDNLLKKK